ncbi:xanthine dehydrogenase family protein molybdopterin-binding subunit [Solirubrobacter ginsenosidimutans]|uniref:Xanthine dehydrogenase family protein molybdopterin-binding subunit n=1 Tax=Solirubrobacter ginsenosidimutans TaxID=490573 RepID=A0A9X3MYS1_9ACTN|nr:xanthine dehydrogenase family protein molybdopterin-binding subunit [Solirubrobacter ginsenosidimutans]MDA0163627.1 xanthine dehydrogenase family protein molybdopterin-binding subunit [Solirubrobacter ginsenosidimutans]
MATETLQWVGRDIKRREDPALLTGSTTFTNDFTVPGLLHAAVLRSPHAHARIRSVDCSRARAVEGVLAVLSGAELAEIIDPMPRFCAEEVVQHAVALEKTRYAGEPVAIAVAETRYLAEDALELVEIDYELLEPLVDPVAAALPGAALVHENLGTNVVYERTFTHGDVEGDFARAAHVVRRTLRWPRVCASPMEPAGAVCDYDASTGRMVVHSNSNMLNFAAWVLSGTLRLQPELIDFHPMYTGGSFGSKHLTAKAISLAGAMSKLTGRPVKFMEDRADNLLANDSQAPDRRYEAALAIDADGRFLSLRTDVVDDYGAYFLFAVAGNTNAMAQTVGPYAIGSCENVVKAVLTNKNQQGVFRGAGSEVHNWVLERLVDGAAQELGIDPIDLRRRNLIQPDQFPYKIPTGNIYDSGDYPAVLDKALAHAELDFWRAEQARGREEGRYIGIGLAAAQQRSTYASTEFWFHNPGPYVGMSATPESVRISVGPTGGISVTLFSPFWGNSPETVAAQLVAEELGIAPEEVSIGYDSTAHGLPSAGPGGSRMTVMLSGAVRGAAGKVRDKMFQIAAHSLEASPEDMELVDGFVRVRGVADEARRLSIADIGMKAYWMKHELPDGMESGLEGTFTYDHPYTTLPSDDRTDLGSFYPMMGHAVHVVVVEVDIHTGHVSFLKFLAVHDVGTVVNPRSLKGQIRGGIAMGIGVTLMEQIRHGADGSALSGSFEEYLMPLAGDVPNVEVLHHETPSPFTAYGVKGGGEGGRMVAPCAITTAVEDALAPFGVRIDALPITPEQIVGWAAS